MPDNPVAAAHELFAALRELDATGASLIWVEAPPDAPRASGTLEAHYAPRAKLRLMDAKMLRMAVEILPKSTVNPVAVYFRTISPPRGVRAVRAMPDNPAAAAHGLFADLRELDATGASLIWVEAPPDVPEWEGVRDRLQRAAAA